MKKIILLGILFFGTGEIMQAHDKKTVTESATFAGGCFWCMQPPFDKAVGVKKVTVGYTGGTGKNPKYENYAQMGHIESIKVEYDPSITSYKKLLAIFWQQIDPTDPDGQFVDRGSQYRAAIFYHTDEQKTEAQKSKEELEKSGRFSKPIVTQILPASPFYPAEDYHQEYYKKSPIKYTFYRSRSGRDTFIKKAWSKKISKENMTFKKPSDEELRKKLTKIQYEVTQKNGTEPAFKNEYADNKREGIYVDIVSGEPLFSSKTKFDSGTGWPSFWAPLEPNNIVEKEDNGWFSTRIEVRSKLADSHLGHVFNDGPKDKTGLRYCMNSAALRFIPAEELDKEGYGQYKILFAKKSHETK